MGYTASDTQRMVTNVIDKMSDGFQEGNCVTIPGFGTSTQQRMLVPPKLVLNFKPAAIWKDKVKKGGNK